MSPEPKLTEEDTAVRYRRTNAELERIDAAIVAAVEESAPLTLRSVFYRVVSSGAIAKTETDYHVIQRQLRKLRMSGSIDWAAIVDGTRITFEADSHGSVEGAITDLATGYQRSIWADQDEAVVLVTEKDAITSVIDSVCDSYQVPYTVLRGYSSITQAWRTARDLDNRSEYGTKAVTVYNLGDHDPSGVDAWRAFTSSVTEFCSYGHQYRRLAVTPEQIDGMGLLTRPTKTTDTRTAKWDDSSGSVEVDAIPPNDLRALVREAIESRIDMNALGQTQDQEGRDIAYLRGLR